MSLKDVMYISICPFLDSLKDPNTTNLEEVNTFQEVQI